MDRSAVRERERERDIVSKRERDVTISVALAPFPHSTTFKKAIYAALSASLVLHSVGEGPKMNSTSIHCEGYV